MKFAQYLESKSIPEWRKAYINYKELKKKLTVIENFRNINHDIIEQHIKAQDANIKSNQSSSNLVVLDTLLKNAIEPEKRFFDMLDKELQKIAVFYDEKETEAEAKHDTLQMQLQIIHSYAIRLSNLHIENVMVTDNHPMNWFNRNSSYKLAKSRLKQAVTEYYRSLELITAYKDLNITGFKKILKKFDKTAGWKVTDIYMNKVNQYHWTTSSKIKDYIAETEKMYIDEFVDGQRRKGMSQLRIPENDQEYTMTTCRIGFYLGLSLGIFARVLQLYSNDRNYNLQIYACFSLPILFCLGFSINCIVWSKSHINYKFIFELDPRDNLDHHEFAELPSFMLLLLAITMYMDFSQLLDPLIPSELCPLIFFVTTMAIMTCPFPILYYSSRRWLSLSLGRILLSYLFPIEFRDFFIADELNSLAYSFWTFSYFICAYWFDWKDLEGQCHVKHFWFTPFLACLPPWWRFLQCIRRYQDSEDYMHLVNGMKYVTSMTSTIVTGYRRMYPSIEVIWILCGIINSSYTSIWDLKMDWGLFQPDSKHVFLRNDLVFDRWVYYIAAPINVLLRFAWTLNTASLGYKGEMIGYLTALLEAYRRIQWNFFRLENEHINNCGNYKAIQEIPLPFGVYPQEPMPVRCTTPAGSFYGRRDFENRQDLDDDNRSGFLGMTRQNSMVGSFFRTRTQHSSDTEDEDE